MRILLVTGEPIQHELAQCLERRGHEITPFTAGGDGLLSAVEQGVRFHAAVLDQSILGKGWPRQVRQLRRRAPYLPALVLLAPGAEHAWRHALLAGAFEALPPHSPMSLILEVLSRALNYSAGRPLQESVPSPAGVGTSDPTAGADLVSTIPAGAQGPR